VLWPSRNAPVVFTPDPRQEEIAASSPVADNPRQIFAALLSQGKHCPPETLQAAKEEVEGLDEQERQEAREAIDNGSIEWFERHRLAALHIDVEHCNIWQCLCAL
jgi:hypothetical protein